MSCKRQLRRFTKNAAPPLLIGGAALVALDAARRVFRLMQLFCPTREPIISWRPEDYGIPPDRCEELWFETGDGAMLHGWYCRAEKPVASALYCHGNTGNLTNTAHVLPHLMRGGINVLTFDYRGFGRSTGRPSLAGVVIDGLSAAKLHDRIRPKDLPSILYGFSLGGAIAAQVIIRHPFDGLILQSTFTSLPDIARASFPRVPLHLLSGRLFETIEVIRTVRVPLMVIHGASDEVCPAWMAHALHGSSAAERKVLQIVGGGLHKDLFTRDTQALVEAINGFAAGLQASEHAADQTPAPLLDQLLDGTFRAIRRQLRRRQLQQAL